MSQGSPHLKTPAPLLAFIISTLQQQLCSHHSWSFHNKEEEEEDPEELGAAGFGIWSVLEVVGLGLFSVSVLQCICSYGEVGVW